MPSAADAQPLPDVTAWLVAQSLVAAGHHPRYQNAIKKEVLGLYEMLAHESSNVALLAKFIHHLPYRWQLKVIGLIADSERVRHFVLRKKLIETQVRKFLTESPVKQVVVLGAGLDVLSLQLAKDFSQVNFIEIDRENSQRFKTGVFHSHHVQLPSNIEYLAGNLSEGLYPSIKRSSCFKENVMTLWLIEGVLMYIPQDACQSLFKEIRELSLSESKVIFTTTPEAYQGSIFARNFQKIYLRKKKSDLAWVISAEDVPHFMEQLNYSMVKQLSYAALHSDYLSPDSPLAKKSGENIHIAKSHGTKIRKTPDLQSHALERSVREVMADA